MIYGWRFVTLYRRQRSRPSPWQTKCKKAKWLSEEALQIAVKRREVKSKGEKERYKHLNAEFQRITRRDQKAFLSNQCKEVEENNRMGKTRDLLKKIRDTKETFHAKMGSLWDSPGQNTGVGCHFLLQGIFPTQGSNPGLPHCRWVLYHLSHQGSP